MDLEKELSKEVEDLDNTPLTFGKFIGLTPEEIAEESPSYIVWLYDTINPKVCSKDLAIYCEWDEREFGD